MLAYWGRRNESMLMLMLSALTGLGIHFCIHIAMGKERGGKSHGVILSFLLLHIWESFAYFSLLSWFVLSWTFILTCFAFFLAWRMGVRYPVSLFASESIGKENRMNEILYVS